ncbi:PepSY-associated TM helix domain-containing protein [soil metagenome]
MAAVPAASAPSARTAAPHPHHRRAAFVRWVRKTHGWFGLWGAILGLTFGFSGIWLNHRAVLKLPAVTQARANSQLALPDPAPATPEAMAAWLQKALELDGPPNNTRIEPARPVAWAEKTQGTPTTAAPRLMQPARWTFNFGGPHAAVQAEYWAGNRSVAVTSTSNGFIATLTNMHKGTGMSVPWILLVDTLAGSLIFLSISGVILWVQTNRRRTVGLSLLGLSVLVYAVIVLMRVQG